VVMPPIKVAVPAKELFQSEAGPWLEVVAPSMVMTEVPLSAAEKVCAPYAPAATQYVTPRVMLDGAQLPVKPAQAFVQFEPFPEPVAPALM
jgi:hypothetical protein